MSCKDNSLHQITNKIFFKKSGTHLLSHTVTSIVPSAAYVLTIVFGMGTGVTRKRIGTEKKSNQRFDSKLLRNFPHLIFAFGIFLPLSSP